MIKHRLFWGMVLVIMLMACSKQQSEHKTVTVSSQYETLRGDVMAMLNENPDSVFIMLDSLETTAQYPVYMINLLRGNVHGQMMNLRFAEFYLWKAVGKEELHDELPKEYYKGLYNLALTLQQKSNLEEALKVAKAGYEEVLNESDPSLKIWETSMQYVIGSCQLQLKQKSEGEKTMLHCYSQLTEKATADTTHASIEQIGTMCTNIALDYYNYYPEASMPWIERAEKALDILAEHNKSSQQPSNEPIMRVKLQMIKAVSYAANGQLKEAKKTYDRVMESPYADHPIILSDKMAYLEKTNQWDKAADLVPAYAEFNEGLELEYTMENMSTFAESYLVYEKAGRKAEATKMAQQLARMVDSVRMYQEKNDAAELAVIYDTQGKERQIAEQQMRLSRARVLALVVSIITLTVFFVVFTIIRHRAAKRLAEMRAAKERMESELNIARGIQMSMVPSRFPEYEGLDIFAMMKPAKEVGGDLYGCLIQGDCLYYCIGDVSGKGVPASLFMAQATRLFHALASQSMTPAEICAHMNAELSGEDNEQGMFVTMFICRLNLKLNLLEYCNAGHNPPVIGNADGQFSFLDMESNAPIGLWPGLEYEGESIEFFKDRLLLLYTDGLNEAEDTEQNQFGDKRLLDTLCQMHWDSAENVIETLTQEVERFRNGAEPNDDLTMLCLRLN